MFEGELKIVNDFKVFCDYLETEKPILSAKKGVLGNKDAFNLNARLYYQRDVDRPNYQQEHYYCLDFLYFLALEGQLFVKVKDEKDRLRLQGTKRLEQFQQLNRYEQYVFLLETYWCCFTIEKSRFSLISSGDLFYLYRLFEVFLDRGAGTPITRKDRLIEKSIRTFFTFDYRVILHLSYFELCSYELNEEAKKPNEDKFLAIIPKNLDIIMLLLLNGAEYRGEIILPPAYRTLAERKMIRTGKKGLHKVLAEAFPEGAVKRTVDLEPVEEKRGTYYFKVALRKKLWRILSLGHDHTMEDFHLAIQGAYDLDDEHLYVFLLDNEKRPGWMQYGIFCSEAQEEYFQAEETTIGECGLYPGQPLLYVYDLGNLLVFDVTLIMVDSQKTPPLTPEIIEEKGEFPGI